MKKLILSAVFALACFSAQAKNEIIKNDDDKNPKNKVKTEKKEVPNLLACRGTVSGTCASGMEFSISVSWSSNDCVGSGRRILTNLVIHCK